MKPIETHLPPIEPKTTLNRQLEALSEQGRYYDQIGKELALKMKYPTKLFKKL